jgi:hypothetical protein
MTDQDEALIQHWIEVKAALEKYLSLRPYPSPEDLDRIVTVYEDEWWGFTRRLSARAEPASRSPGNGRAF